jgi:LPS sulfotransferase NodH
MDKFIILSAHRSGTTLLLSFLESHPKIQCYKRVFSIDVVIRRMLMVDRPGSPFYEYRTTSFKRRMDYIFRKKQLLGDFLTELYTPTNSAEVIGIRVIYQQLDKHRQILQWAVENNVGIIHLIRENSLKTLVSAETARLRAVAHSTSKVDIVTVRLSPLKLKMQLARLTGQIEKHRRQLKDILHLELTYESLVAQSETETNRVLNFLEIQERVPLTTNLVKLNPNSLEDIIENYAEIKQTLSGTNYEQFLN